MYCVTPPPFRGAWISKNQLKVLLKNGSHIIRIISARGKDGFPIYLLEMHMEIGKRGENSDLLKQTCKGC